MSDLLCIERGIHVSTMTVTAKVVGSYMVPVSEYAYVFAGHLPRNMAKSRRFNNQYTICVGVDGGARVLNVKVFGNGTLQVSGCRHMGDMESLNSFLKLHGHMEIGEYNVSMINSNFSCGHAIRLYDLAVYFREMGCHVNYDSQRHPGLQLRYMWNASNLFGNGICSCVVGVNGRGEKDMRYTRCGCHKVTCLVFSTGKCVITGANTMQQILETHEYLVGVIKDFGCAEALRVKRVRKRKKEREEKKDGKC